MRFVVDSQESSLVSTRNPTLSGMFCHRRSRSCAVGEQPCETQVGGGAACPVMDCAQDGTNGLCRFQPADGAELKAQVDACALESADFNCPIRMIRCGSTRKATVVVTTANTRDHVRPRSCQPVRSLAVCATTLTFARPSRISRTQPRARL